MGERRTHRNRARKYFNFARAYLLHYLVDSTPFVRFIPTDRCNLACAYCWQRSTDPRAMSLSDFETCLVKAKSLGVGLVSFSGGEPTLWEYLCDAIALCSANHILTDLTTNGTRLDRTFLHKLGSAGLDFLNVSTDGLRKTSVTEKTFGLENDMPRQLNELRVTHGVRIRLNAVICKNTRENLDQLLARAKAHSIPISLGFIVAPFRGGPVGDIYFSAQDIELAQRLAQHIVDIKRGGCPIIDPDSYFDNFVRYLRRERFWTCNYATGMGWINVAPTGRIRGCTKKMNDLGKDFATLTRSDLRTIRKQLREGVEICNVDCYSNCAYDSFYYRTHKWRMLERVRQV